MALALLNFKSNQFGGGGGGWLLPTVPGTPGFTNGKLNFGPLILTSTGKFTDDQFTTNWDRELGAARIASRSAFPGLIPKPFSHSAPIASRSRPAAYPRQIT